MNDKDFLEYSKVVMRLPRKLQKSTIVILKENMIDPILYLSMILGLTGMYVLISSFGDDNDDGERYIYNPEYVKVGG